MKTSIFSSKYYLIAFFLVLLSLSKINSNAQCVGGCPLYIFKICNNTNCVLPMSLAASCCSGWTSPATSIPTGCHFDTISQCLSTDCGYCCADGIVIDGLVIPLTTPGIVTQDWPNPTVGAPWCSNCPTGIRLMWDNTVVPAQLTITCY